MNYIRFSSTYNHQQLCAELENVLQQDWPLHFNTRDFDGEWRSISLRSASGNSQDILAHPEAQYQDTPVLAMMPYAKEIIDSWKCEKEAVRLLSLSPGSEIKPHKDPGCGYRDGVFRIHIPIMTNPEVYFMLEEEKLRLQSGECWYMDFSCTHAIVNKGYTARVHLIMDCIRNEWSDQLFAGHGYDIATKRKSPQMDPATRTAMIAELERMDTDTTRALIARLKAEQ
ncbi:aspartyl/asparaginyl beta-hydroxylase domain-containing protein [Chitinophaga pinensis]|uniref:Aspartyl/Asparaginyl beta-hydroxylase n=1 Tax=Chitinophaga pinensis (strain ATCC 43595 / DSM 2588 / LMG 13176 / NBRC 15968 / NCIMB 11800 / UQM 2034) TaxID=485918 RepID=A0A979G9C0_CHIPD|nr:aspartyl/asparaginyl beta-hydroxylase domain-containing protein [Chitinophaga pinensis]ACU63324.1 Aspartyl/Asparaginyl beta-hydroxylase [Chitinophaga pinensis DSM 2588]